MSYPAELEKIDVVFTGPPGPGVEQMMKDRLRELLAAGNPHTVGDAIAAALREAIQGSAVFIETEDAQGRGIGVGDWRLRNDGRYVLRLEVNAGSITRDARSGTVLPESA